MSGPGCGTRGACPHRRCRDAWPSREPRAGQLTLHKLPSSSASDKLPWPLSRGPATHELSRRRPRPPFQPGPTGSHGLRHLHQRGTTRIEGTRRTVCGGNAQVRDHIRADTRTTRKRSGFQSPCVARSWAAAMTRTACGLARTAGAGVGGGRLDRVLEVGRGQAEMGPCRWGRRDQRPGAAFKADLKGGH
jgi:hypothetical protein